MARPDPRRRRPERRPRMAFPAARAVPTVRRFDVRRPEERLHAPSRIARAGREVPAGVRGRRAVGAHRHVEPRLPRALARRLLPGAGRHRVRRTLDCGARPLPRMNFEPTDEQELLRRTVRDFAESRVAPIAAELDREERFPYELVGEMAELGLMGIPIPEEYGDAGADTLSYAIAIEELTRVDSSVAITVAALISLGTMPIYLFGDDEISNISVPTGLAGYEISPPMRKLGWRASDTRELAFKDCTVPERNLLGQRGRGFR